MFHRIQVFRGTSTRQGDKGCSTRSLEHRLRLSRRRPAAPRRDSVWKDTRPRQRGVAHSPNRTTDTPPLRKGGSPRPAGGGTPSCGAKPGTPWTCLQCGGREPGGSTQAGAEGPQRAVCKMQEGAPAGGTQGAGKAAAPAAAGNAGRKPRDDSSPSGPHYTQSRIRLKRNL